MTARRRRGSETKVLKRMQLRVVIAKTLVFSGRATFVQIEEPRCNAFAFSDRQGNGEVRPISRHQRS